MITTIEKRVNPLIIDIFKDDSIFRRLATFNDELKQIFHKVCFYKNAETIGEKFMEGGFYYRKDPTRHIGPWFNPFRMNEVPFPQNYPHTVQLNYDIKFRLLEWAPNYVSMFLIDKFYNDKAVLIEDVCCGQGKFAFYMSKLGYKNFSMIDDFSQLMPELFHETMAAAASGTKYVLNDKRAEPVIVNHVGYPNLVRSFPQSVELICLYNNVNIIKAMDENTNFKRLCSDSDNFLYGYVRHDKYEEFAEKLKPYA